MNAHAQSAVSEELSPERLATFREHWQDESDAAYLYGVLAELESNPERASVFRRLQEVERRHAQIWADLLAKAGKAPSRFRPTLRARLLALIGRRFGAGALVSLLLREEGREVRAYVALHRATAPGAAGAAEALLLARESAQHASELAELAGSAKPDGEPWHRTESGGFLRNVVYGFNDGLTANFGLVAGVIGATVADQHQAVLVAGVAGLIADSLSMGASGYLAAKSEREVYEHEIAMEREEIALMPELERDELALIYEARGMAPAAARELASDALRDPERMLEEKVQLELGIGAQTTTPLREGTITGLATAFGALIPVFPFLVTYGRAAIVSSFAISMAAHFLVGAARSVFTGRSIFRSGVDMFIVGLGVAAVGYIAGEWVSRWLIG
ncbi:MAG TPA: VIT1/CCC1 transporter family protein [Gemmatimonadaceae bacterium]|nr:VIT1/CCC1 transporter family protein [Gemmatimonadaceae bacterium]